MMGNVGLNGVTAVEEKGKLHCVQEFLGVPDGEVEELVSFFSRIL